MQRLLDFIEQKTVRILTRRKAARLLAATSKPKRTFMGEVKGWVDALVFAVFAVLLINQYLFQLFVIPSPSMVSTLNVGDRVFVSKTIYGIEVYPGGPKVASSNRQVARDQIITFYNPEYTSRGPLFDILSQIIYMGTFSLVNIDRKDDGTMAERLYVKRSVGLPGETIRFVNGKVLIRPAGMEQWIEEETFRSSLSLVDGPHRSVDDKLYSGIRAWGSLFGYQDEGIDLQSVPSYLRNDYALVAQDNYPDDMYAFSESQARTQSLFDPSNMEKRGTWASYERGIYVPSGHILPLGDNRDNSRDGRYFGPVSQKRINGSVRLRFWPLSRIAYLGNK
ncbi:MAG TPA: signal peptidase I [Sphaerochaeta sp.]|jgi:signal peptidase I|nr:signal peptidase I [Sphaerochaeta sp.]